MYAVKSGDAWLEDVDGAQRSVSKGWHTPYDSFAEALDALKVPATWALMARHGVPEVVDLDTHQPLDLAMLHSRVAGFSGHLGDGIGALREALLVALEELQGRHQVANMRADEAARATVARCLTPLPPRCAWVLPLPSNVPVLHMGSAEATFCGNLGAHDRNGGDFDTSTCADCGYVGKHTMHMHDVATELTKNASPAAHLSRKEKNEARVAMCAMTMRMAREALANRVTFTGGTTSCAP